MKRIELLLIATTIAVLVYGCGDDSGTSPGTSELTLEFSDLPALGGGFVYEGWLITPDAVSTGRFTVDEDGVPSESRFAVDTSTATAASAFVLTIEPGTGDVPAPSDTHVVAGGLADNAAVLSIAHAAALGNDFTSAAGEYILAAPTGGEDAPFQYGIWWLIPGDTPTAGLSLPALPAGWEYEGWVATTEGPVSTGRFIDVAAPDSDGAGPDAGPDTDAAPPFPGQDFVDPPPRDLTAGYTAVISVEPEPDDGPAPFILKPLVHEIGSIMPLDTQTMNNNAAATSPSGTATVTP